MGSPKDNDPEIHFKVEYEEKLGLGEGKHGDSSQLCQRDATQHLETQGKYIKHVQLGKPWKLP